MKTTSTVLGVLLASVLMTACAKKDAPAEAAPAETPAPAEVAPAPEAAPAEAPAATTPNDEDAGQTSGDKVAPQQ